MQTHPLKLIIMSATLNAELFESYFNAKVVYVKGRQFPVRTFYTLVPEPNYLDATLITILQVATFVVVVVVVVFVFVFVAAAVDIVFVKSLLLVHFATLAN
jgi:HrpA-like RNA helicase